MSASAYLKKHQYAPAYVNAPICPNLGMLVVLPCYNEPDVLSVLDALLLCRLPTVSVEVLLVLNHAEHAPPECQRQNDATYQQVMPWIKQHTTPQRQFHCLYYPNLPRKHAGVGLARKLGLDEAVARLHQVHRQGLLVNLDADCVVGTDYLCAIERAFQAHPNAPGGHVYFEHPLTGSGSAAQDQGMLRYELYLRYYRRGLLYAGSPYAFHTIGSCIVVRANVYAQIGGMNRRQAGEDFYFLQKLRSMGPIIQITETVVRPSARLSERVPFGTGRAIEAWLSSESDIYLSYHPQVFAELKTLHAALPALYAEPEQPPLVSVLMQQFWGAQQGAQKVFEIHANAARWVTFEKRFYQWFNGFMCLKFIHFAQANHYPQVDLQPAANELLTWAGQSSSTLTYADLLARYRQLDRAD